MFLVLAWTSHFPILLCTWGLQKKNCDMFNMTCYFVFPFTVWWWGDEVAMQVKKRHKKEKITLPNDAWKGNLKTWNYNGERADTRWVMAYRHKTQSFMKNGGQQKCLDKALPPCTRLDQLPSLDLIFIPFTTPGSIKTTTVPLNHGFYPLRERKEKVLKRKQLRKSLSFPKVCLFSIWLNW